MDLKPCPFCGSDASMMWYYSADVGYYIQAGCKMCGSSGAKHTCETLDEDSEEFQSACEDAKNEWNRRNK